jgi:hypothetical protein
MGRLARSGVGTSRARRRLRLPQLCHEVALPARQQRSTRKQCSVNEALELAAKVRCWCSLTATPGAGRPGSAAAGAIPTY